MTTEEIDAMLKEAERRGYERAKWDSIGEDVAEIKAWIKAATPILAKMKDELDGDEDGDFITKVSSAASAAVQIKDSLKDFKL